MRFTPLLAVLLTSSAVSAHPGHDLREEILERRAFKNSVRAATLDHCASTLKARGLEARNQARRAAAVDKARLSRGLQRRDADSVSSESHNETDTGYTKNTDASELFADAACVLTPEVTEGPYYVGGEFVRTDLTEDQAGVDIGLEYQVIDVDTCEPVPNVYVEMWHCNATGVYSGVVASGNGNSDDESNLDKTFLRGLQKTDSDGVAQFDSVFPGHYTGRATHIHVMVHHNVTVNSNNTVSGDVYASHVGQAFFDQDLISAVDEVSPYSSNTQETVKNTDDSIFSEEADSVDPLMSYAYLGDNLSDGLFAWLAFGINTSYVSQPNEAATYYASGGVANENSGMGGGPGGDAPGGAGGAGGGPPGNMTANGTATGVGGAGEASSTAASTQSATGTAVAAAMANTYTAGAVVVSLIGLFLPLVM